MKSYDLYSILKAEKFDFLSGVPCSYFSSLFNHILDDRSMKYVAAPNEGLATSIVAGAAMAGKKGAVIMQNAGLGNAINPITSLCINYKIPMLFFISGRAYGSEDEPQHKVMGESMHAIMKAISMPSYDLSDKKDEAQRQIAEARAEAFGKGIPVALVVKKGMLEKDKTDCARQQPAGSVPCYYTNPWREDRMSMTAALKTITSSLDDNTALISTTGTISRELSVIKDVPGNFYMQGSMGHAAGIGLGVALSNPKKVVVLDGDGALIMHMGILSAIGYYAPKNLMHVVLDNETYESTGSQFTTSCITDFARIAYECEYSASTNCSDTKTLEETVKDLASCAGPSFLHAKVGKSESKSVPRVTKLLSQPQLTARFSSFLANLCA